jgi:hypothetical protein
VQDLGASAGHEQFLQFEPCGLCSSTEPHCHCPYMDSMGGGVPFSAPSRKFPRYSMLVRSLKHTSEKGWIVVPQGASSRFQRIGTFMLPGHSVILDPWCYPQDSMGAFDRMKLRDLAPGV